MTETSKTKKVFFHTLGCKLNFAETSYLGKKLIEKGYEKTKEEKTKFLRAIHGRFPSEP